MPVTETMMKPGSWHVTLRPDTPKQVRDSLNLYGHILIFGCHIDPRIISGLNAFTAALYIGVLRNRPTPLELEGASILIWLGDDQDVSWGNGAALGGLSNAARNETGADFGTCVRDIMVGIPMVSYNTITNILTPTLTVSYIRMTPRKMLDDVCAWFGGEYKIYADPRGPSPAFAVDAGPAGTLYKSTPTVIFVPHGGGRESGSLLGIEPDKPPNLQQDVEQTAQALLLVGGTGSGAASTGAGLPQDLNGNTFTLWKVVQDGNVQAGNENAMAAQQAPKWATRQAFSLGCERFAITRDITAGDYVYVWDPQNGIEDTTNPIPYRGSVAYPKKLRCYTVGWPIEAGMSVWFFNQFNQPNPWVDLTPYVVYESKGVTFEVGAPPKGLTQLVTL